MKILNRENVITNNQISAFIKLLGNNYQPRELIIYERKIDLLRYLIKSIVVLPLLLMILLNKLEGLYLPIFDKVYIFVFAQNDDGNDKHSKQLYSLHALAHELRHKWQRECNKKSSEKDADDFATNFINSNSSQISEIMNWEDEWEVGEE